MPALPNFGTCLSVTSDLPMRWRYSTGVHVVAEALVRRLTTPWKKLNLVSPATSYGADYGYDVRQLLGGQATATGNATAQTRITAECMKDPRVETAATTLAYTLATSTLTITINLTTGAGPFTLVIQVTSAGFTAQVVFPT